MSAVSSPERSRLLEAMLEELVEKGYRGVEVEAAVRRAHLSGAEWLVMFPDKDKCLIAAFDQLTAQLRAAICAGCAGAGDWPGRIARGLGALLAELSRRAPMAEALARTLPSIGPAAQARYQGFVEGLAALLVEGRESSETGAELPDEVELLAVGAVEAIVYDEIGAGRTAKLTTLGPELLFSLLVPFLGPAAAAVEMEKMRSGEDLGRLEPA